ncbi:MAG TPA: NAD(P)H-binding protein [Candidatus Limnocylindrales bacterium]
MIVIAGGSGRLGTLLARRFVSHGVPVRLLTRSKARVASDLVLAVEVVEADVTDERTLEPALRGASVVVSAISGFGGRDALGARAVDDRGTAALVRAAEAAGAERFVLVSVLGASPTSRIGLFRAKAAAETALRQSRLVPTIIRPTAYAETWLELVGGPVAETGRTRVFGRGRNPVNFVSADDVAAIVEHVVTDDGWAGAELDVAGPENLTLDEVAGIAATALGRDVRIDHTPLAAMRVMATATSRVRPALSDQVRAAILMDTADMRANASARLAAFPDVPLTTVREVAALMFARATAVLPLEAGAGRRATP